MSLGQGLLSASLYWSKKLCLLVLHAMQPNPTTFVKCVSSSAWTSDIVKEKHEKREITKSDYGHRIYMVETGYIISL